MRAILIAFALLLAALGGYALKEFAVARDSTEVPPVASASIDQQISQYLKDHPEEVLGALRRSPDQFASDLRLAAAMFWYVKGELSQERAAKVAGLTRAEFVDALSRERVEVFQVDADDLKRHPSAIVSC